MSRFFVLTFLLLVSQPVFALYDVLLEKVLTQSTEIQIAKSQVREKNYSYASSLSHWLPKLDLRFGHTTQKDFSLLTSGQLPAGLSAQPQEVSQYNWAVQASFPVFRKTLIDQIGQTSTQSELAELNLMLKAKELEIDFTNEFSQFLVQEYQLATLKQTLSNAEGRLAEIQKRFELGQRTEIDYLRAKTNVFTLSSRVQKTEISRDQTLKGLFLSAGLTKEEGKTLFEEKAPHEPSAIEQYLEKYAEISPWKDKIELWTKQPEKFEEQVAQSALLKRIELEEETAVAAARSVVNLDYPDLMVTGQLYKNTPNWDDTFSGNLVSYSYGVQLVIPLYLGGSAVTSHLELSEKKKAAQLKAAAERDQFLIRAQTLREKVMAEQHQLEGLELNLQTQARIFKFSQKSYDLGKISINDFLDDENTYLESKVQYLSSKVELLKLLKQMDLYLTP